MAEIAPESGKIPLYRRSVTQRGTVLDLSMHLQPPRLSPARSGTSSIRHSPTIRDAIKRECQKLKSLFCLTLPMHKASHLALLLLLLLSGTCLADHHPSSDQSERSEDTIAPAQQNDLRWVALLIPRRNIRAGEQLHEEDFDQVAVGYRPGEEPQGFVPANVSVAGLYALEDLYVGQNIDRKAIGEQAPRLQAHPSPITPGFADQLAWFSFERLSPGTIAPGFRLQLKRVRKESLPAGALEPNFKPPHHFRVVSTIEPDRPILESQIEIVD